MFNCAAIFATKVSLKWDLSDMMSVMATLLYQYDANFTNLVTEANGTALLSFESPHKFGAMLITQARF